MNALAAGLLVILAALGSGFGGSWLTARLARKTARDAAVITAGQNELQGRRDAEAMRSEAFNQAFSISKQTIAGLLEDVARLKLGQVALEERAELAERTLAEARAAFEDYVSKVQGLLRSAGIPVPAFEFHRW